MSQWKIPMVDLLGQFREIESEVMTEISQVIESTSFINGAIVHEFATSLSDYHKIDYVIPCGNGTDALQLALMALDLPKGSKIVVPAFTYIATVEVIALLGMTPVFVDVDPDTFNLDPLKLESVLDSQKIEAIIVVHLYGQAANMGSIQDLAVPKEIPVVEDNAQAIGAEYQISSGNWKKTGTIGTIGTTSFFPSKNLGAYGDGGAVMTNDPSLGAQLKMIANHGQSKKYYHDIVGVNSRLDSMQAAILKVKLKYLDNYIDRRRDVATYYDERLSKLEEVQIPQRTQNSTHVFHQYTIKVKNTKRDSLKEYLQSQGIPSVIYYPVPQHLQKAYLKYGFKKGDFPVSEQLCLEVLSLPIHTQMNEDHLDLVCSTIESFYS